jgi:PAS domain S-box-containing protein
LTKTRPSTGWLWTWFVVVGLAAGYVVTARLGLILALPPEKKATAVWPPSGIALAALLLLGFRIWPGIWLGAFLANLWDYFNPANPFPLTAHLLVSAGIATGSTLQALAGSFLVRRWIGPTNPFDRASHAFAFVGVAMLMCLIAATCGVSSLYVGGFAPGQAVGFIWWTWWLGDMTGVLTVGALILTWSDWPPFIMESRRLIEAALFLVLLLALASAIFGIVSPVVTLPPPLAYLTVPFVVWATFRFGLHGAATTIFLLSIIAVLGTSQGTGPFTQPTVQESLLLLQMFMGVIAVTALVMAAVLNERRAAEIAVQSSQQREKERADELEAILRATPTPIWIAHDPDCHRITGNPASFTLLGLPEGTNVSATSPYHDPSKRGFREYRGDTPIPSNEMPVQRAARGELVERAEVKFVFDDGRVRHIYGNAVPLRNPDGSVRGCVAAFADVTPLKEAEEALRQSEQRLRQLAENINEVFWMTDTQTTRLLYISPAYERVWGRSCQSLYENPRSFMDAVHPDDRERVRIDVLDRQSRGEQIDKEYRVVRPDGSIRWVRDRAFPVKNAEGQFYRLVGIIDDFTEKKQVEEALKEANRRKDDFLATLAHELRNPLAPIRNAVELMRRANGNGAVTEMARSMIERQVGQMVRLVDDLLDISRITRGKLYLRKERIELAAVVRSAVEASRPFIDAQAHQLTLTLPSEPIHLHADPIRLAQVFSNLLTNAAKYTEKGGHIWLTAERQDSELVVSVRDTGIGIAAEHLPHLFEMFSQVAPALERSQGGLGIGLALVRGLVELHGGRVEVRSAGLRKGSEFIVHLPMVDSPMPVPQEPVEKFRSGTKRRILVVDDNRDAADSMVMMLQMMGHETSTAYDGLEAVQAAATFRPEVVLLDIGLPKMNGYEAAQHIREQPWGRQMALIALTGWGQEEDKRRALEAGFDHHLTKPVEAVALEKLLAIISPVTHLPADRSEAGR